MMDELNCDIAYVLQNRDFTILKRLISHCHDFHTKIAAKIEDTTTYEIECAEKRTLSSNRISEMQQEIERLKSELDATKLQQKILDKKIANSRKEQEELKDEIEDAKSTRDSLSLEMVDLQQEKQKRNELKISTWKAIRTASNIYKENLDIHIHLEDDNECERVKVSFFIKHAATKEKYYVCLTNYKKQWKVEEIQPTLKKECYNDFKDIVDISKHSEVSNITAFLCNLRQIFVKYYLNKK